MQEIKSETKGRGKHDTYIEQLRPQTHPQHMPCRFSVAMLVSLCRDRLGSEDSW